MAVHVDTHSTVAWLLSEVIRQVLDILPAGADPGLVGICTYRSGRVLNLADDVIDVVTDADDDVLRAFVEPPNGVVEGRRGQAGGHRWIAAARGVAWRETGSIWKRAAAKALNRGPGSTGLALAGNEAPGGTAAWRKPALKAVAGAPRARFLDAP